VLTDFVSSQHFLGGRLMSPTYPADDRHHSREVSPSRMLALVASNTDVDHAIMEICLRVPGAVKRRRITLQLSPASGHGRISVFT
jgi:hypothetical protein